MPFCPSINIFHSLHTQRPVLILAIKGICTLEQRAKPQYKLQPNEYSDLRRVPVGKVREDIIGVNAKKIKET